GVYQLTERPGVAAVYIQVARLGCINKAAVAIEQHDAHFEDEQDRNQAAERQILPEAFAQLGQIDVEHHDYKQEQHHDGANVDEHERDSQKFRLQLQPQTRRSKKGENQ